LNRSLEASARSETTDNRATAAGVMGLVTESSPVPLVPPAPAARVSSTLRASPVPASPKATLVGMAAPTVGAAPAATTTEPDAIDRMSPTASIDTDVAPVPPHGTEALEGRPAEPVPSPEPGDVDEHREQLEGATVPSGPPTDAMARPIEWPPERAPVPSEEPQVRSVPAVAPGASRGALVAVGAGAAMLAVLAVLAAGWRGGGRSSGREVGAPSPVSPVSLPRPVELEVVPAPTLAPPAFDLGELADTPRAHADAKGVKTEPSAQPPAAAPPPAAPASPAVTARPPAKIHPAADRPGPGF
jgi:hypothetical protein